MDEKPADAAREKRDSSLFAACRAVGQGEADVVVSAGNTGAMLAAGLLEIGRLPDVQPAGDRRAAPGPTRPVGADRRGRERRRAARAPAPVRPHGRDLRRGDPRHPRPEGRPALDRRGAGEGQPADARGARAARRRRPLRFVGNVEGRDCCSRAPPTSSSATASPATWRSRCSRARSARCSTSFREEMRAVEARQGRRAADPAGGPRPAPRGSTRTPTAARYLLGLRGPRRRSRTATRRGRRSRTRSGSAARGVRARRRRADGRAPGSSSRRDGRQSA